MRARILYSALAAVAMVLAAHASTRTSATYAISADVIDCGGETLNGGSYTMNTSVHVSGGTDTDAGDSIRLKTSYPGQLTDLTALQASASPTNIDEAATRQLDAVAVYDDDTVGDIDGAPEWSIVDGPLASIDGAGLATASNVYEDTIASARAIYASLTGDVGLVIINTNWDDYSTYASDGVPDDWQTIHFGITNPLALGGEDPDGDEQINRFEWVVNTEPTNSDSYFAMVIDRVDGVSTQASITYSPAYDTRNYTIQYVTNIQLGSWSDLAGYSETTSGTDRTATDLGITNDTLLYRIHVEYSLP